MDPRASPGSITRARTGAHRQGKGGAARGQEEGYEGGKTYPPSTLHHPPSQCVASCCAAGNLWALGFDETDSLGFDDTDRVTFCFLSFLHQGQRRWKIFIRGVHHTRSDETSRSTRQGRLKQSAGIYLSPEKLKSIPS